MKHLVITSRIIFISIFAILTIVSCSPARNESGKTPEVPVLPQNQIQDNTIETQTPATATSEPDNLQSSEEKSAQVTINPPHGEPGHRCDIPVGAALNSSPVNTARQAVNTSPTVTSPNIANSSTAPTIENAKRLNSSQPVSTASSQNSGMLNPPHGQPGHRCEIPVGSPLP